MGHSYAHVRLDTVPDSATFGQDEYAACMTTVRQAVPRWARSHPEFEGLAGLCIAEALKGYDASRGVPFTAYLTMRAKSRIPTIVARDRQRAAREISLDEMEEVNPAAAEAITMSTELPTEFTVVSSLQLGALIARLPHRQSEVAARIAAGESPSQAAAAMGVTVSAVCNAMRRTRPAAETVLATTTSNVVAA
jgi:DNA-directed RNA polymerase specialized sigma24 family protein